MYQHGVRWQHGWRRCAMTIFWTDNCWRDLCLGICLVLPHCEIDGFYISICHSYNDKVANVRIVCHSCTNDTLLVVKLAFPTTAQWHEAQYRKDHTLYDKGWNEITRNIRVLIIQYDEKFATQSIIGSFCHTTGENKVALPFWTVGQSISQTQSFFIHIFIHTVPSFNKVSSSLLCLVIFKFPLHLRDNCLQIRCPF